MRLYHNKTWRSAIWDTSCIFHIQDKEGHLICSSTITKTIFWKTEINAKRMNFTLEEIKSLWFVKQKPQKETCNHCNNAENLLEQYQISVIKQLWIECRLDRSEWQYVLVINPWQYQSLTRIDKTEMWWFIDFITKFHKWNK